MTPATLRRKVDRLARPKVEALVGQIDTAWSEIFGKLSFSQMEAVYLRDEAPEGFADELSAIDALAERLRALEPREEVITAIRYQRTEPLPGSDLWPDARVLDALPPAAQALVHATTDVAAHFAALRREAEAAGVSLD